MVLRILYSLEPRRAQRGPGATDPAAPQRGIKPRGAGRSTASAIASGIVAGTQPIARRSWPASRRSDERPASRSAASKARGFAPPTMARKLSAAARGYGSAHRARRARLKPFVEAGSVRCVRCGELIKAGEKWDLGHVDGTERTVYSGPEHRFCNRRTAAHKREKNWSRQW